MRPRPRACRTSAGASTACRRRTACCSASAACASRCRRIDLVFAQPRALLGDRVSARFGDEFPIRFDFLDTMGGGNLSSPGAPADRIHPAAVRHALHAGRELLHAGRRAGRFRVTSACETVSTRRRCWRDLDDAASGRAPFAAERHVDRWPAQKHDHFLIPAGTVHCSGANAMVLEISATPYIFTFKLWDWARLGLDGKPRPIHLEHGAANIQWDRTHRHGCSGTGQPRRAARQRRRLARGTNRPARARVHRDPAALVHEARAARHARRRQRAEPRAKARRRSSKARPARSIRSSCITPRRSSCQPRSDPTRSAARCRGSDECATLQASVRGADQTACAG